MVVTPPPLARVGALGWRLGHRAWWTLSPRLRLPCPVVVVGNVVVGGAGKSPIVAWLAKHLAEGARMPHVAMLGYGGRARGGGLRDYTLAPLRRVGGEPIAAAKPGAGVPIASVDPREVGDEAIDLAEQVSVPVWCGARRATITHAASHGAAVVLVDDGMQHPFLARALQLLVFDLDDPAPPTLLPWGRYREPLATGLARADAVILTGAMDGNSLPATVSQALTQVRPDVPVVRVTIATGPPMVMKNAAEPLAAVPETTPLVVAAGIGRPQKFVQGLARQGYAIAATQFFPDHHPYTAQNLDVLQALARQHHATIVVTSKDWVKLRRLLRRQATHLQDGAVWSVAAADLLWHADDGHRLLETVRRYRDTFA